MSMKVTNAPSLANCDIFTLAQDVKELAAGGVEVVHVDIMDGHYVPNLCFAVSAIADITRNHPALKSDVHLMVEDPAGYVDPLADAGASYVSFHSDSTRYVRRTIAALHARGVKAGVAINPSQPVRVIEPYIHDLDYVVLMTVEPGFAGQKVLEGSLERVEELAGLREQTGTDFAIEIDGGVDPVFGAECVRRGADMLVTGIYAVFDQHDGIEAAVRRFDTSMIEAAQNRPMALRSPERS